MSSALSARRRLKGRTAIGLIVAAGLLLLVGANAHLVYVAVTSQPDCVAHLRQGDDTADGSFRAAKSSCSPGARS